MTYQLDSFLSFSIGMMVLLAGVDLTRRSRFLRTFNIPEPVTGGFIAALAFLIVQQVTGWSIAFDLTARDYLLVYFFTGIGLNADLSDLVRGGRPFLVLLTLTMAFLVIQNLVGMAGAAVIGEAGAIGVLAGSASLIGGHGTAIAWAPEVESLGVTGAMEIGVAFATFGLIVASLIGGPLARFLISRHGLSSGSHSAATVGVAYEDSHEENIDHLGLVRVLLTLHITIFLGFLLNRALTEAAFKLPLFVSCLLTGIVLSNTVPRFFRSLPWPARTAALAVVSDFSLGLFLAMSLMSMQLWTLGGFAGPLVVILILQTCATVAFILLLLFPLLGRNYEAAVLSAGFGGFAMGATPTAIANMTAVTKAHGPAPTAFVTLPLVAAFFVDLANSMVIRTMLTLG